MDHPARRPAAVVLLHWTMAAALIAMLTGGLAMTQAAEHASATGDFAVTVAGPPPFELYQLHKSVEALLFALVLMRLVLRVVFSDPAPPSSSAPPHAPPPNGGRREARMRSFVL